MVLRTVYNLKPIINCLFFESLIFWDHGIPYITETIESKTMDKGDLR